MSVRLDLLTRDPHYAISKHFFEDHVPTLTRMVVFHVDDYPWKSWNLRPPTTECSDRCSRADGVSILRSSDGRTIVYPQSFHNGE
jgi:hypothetical protein